MEFPQHIPQAVPSDDTVDKLNELIAHHRTTLEVCDAAAPRLDDIVERGEIRDMASDHLRHLDQLARCVEKLGGHPTRIKADLPAERGDVVELVRDERLLTAVLADEEAMAKLYGNVVDDIHSSDRIEQAVGRGLELIDKHRHWLRDELQASA